MAGIEWSDDARKDLERVQWFLYGLSPKTAIRMAKAILISADVLMQSPKIGRPLGDDSDRREYYVPFGGSYYVLRYMLTPEDDIIVLRVWHGRENRIPV